MRYIILSLIEGVTILASNASRKYFQNVKLLIDHKLIIVYNIDVIEYWKVYSTSLG